MNKIEGKKIAIVCDWIKDMGGAELVLEQFLEIFPQADIFTSVFFPNKKFKKIFKNRNIKTSFIQKIPFLNKSHKLALIFRPLAFESFDLSEYDIVISSTSAESKGVITKPETLQICYCHTPVRYFWSHYHEYLNMMEFGFLNTFGKYFMPKFVHKLRNWDFCASGRPDFFIANSENTKKRIKKYYNRNSKVIYPGIDIGKFNTLSHISQKSHSSSLFKAEEENEEFYFYIGRCIPYKKFDLLVDAFNKNGKKIILATNTNNKLYKSLKSKSNDNIKWKLNISFEEKVKLFSQAKAFLFPPEEDFGLVPIEAMATGTPVIAYKKGGVLETVLENETGIFFENQTVESLNDAIKKFEKISFNKEKIKKHAKKFDKKIFKKEFLEFLEERI